MLKLWGLRGLFMWKSSVEVGDVSLELGQKFRAGDVDLAIKRETTEIKGVKKILPKKSQGAKDEILCDFSGFAKYAPRTA